MATELHTFDPDGDLLLILNRLPEETTDPNTNEENTESQPTPIDADPQANAEDPTIPTPEESNTPLSDALVLSTPLSDPAPLIPVHLLVSSKHMTLISPVFRAMLHTPNFKEGIELHSKGRLELELPDDNADAFIIIMNIVHAKHRSVPKEVELETLSEVGVLVDKYQMGEAVEVYTDSWIERLKGTVPEKYGDEEELSVHRWLESAWVFSKKEIFNAMSKLIERGSRDDLHDRFDSSVPLIVLETITKKREEALFRLYAFIESTLRHYQRKEIVCRRNDGEMNRSACNAMLLGSLLKSACIANLYPTPPPPYVGITFNAIFDAVKVLKYEALCDRLSRVSTGDTGPQSHMV